MASTSESSVNVLTVKPAADMSVNTPMRLTGMVTSGITEARRVRRKTKTTSATSTTASSVVAYTALMERSMNTELSLAITNSRSPGRSCWIRGRTSRTPAEMSSGLAVALRITPAEIAGLPFRRTTVRSLAAPCSMRATSLRRTVWPLTTFSAI